MPWTVQPFNKLMYSVNGGTAYQWNGFQMPIRFGDATNVIYSHGYQIYQYTDGARRGYDEDKYLLMYGALDGGNGLDFWYYIAKVLANGEEIEIFREDDPNKNIALIISRLDSAQIRFGSRVYGIYNWLPAGNEVAYVSSAWSIEPPAGRDLISPPTMNIGFCTNGTKFNLYVTQQWGTWSDDPFYDDNGYWLNCLQNVNSMSTCIAFLLAGNVPPPPTSDPYAPAGPSTTTPTGTGTFDAQSDPIALPSTPTLSAQSSGLISLYVIDTANMATFANFLLSGSFNDSTLKKLFTSPMEAILCLNYFPYTPPKAGTATEISIGKAATGANGYLLTGQYDTVSCGTVDLDEYYGSCLDMSPYTSVSLVLPYCGAVDLDPDEFMGKTIGVTYKIDCYTGACLALVTADGNVMLQVQGMLSNPMPIMASNYSSIVSGIASTAIAALGTLIAVGTGGVGTPAAIAMAGGVAAVGANSVMNAKVHYNHGGSGGMGTGLFGVQKPYLIVKRPRACVPNNNGNFQGYPTFVTIVLGNCSGYTKINEIHLDGITATDAEKKELESILKGGVWF